MILVGWTECVWTKVTTVGFTVYTDCSFCHFILSWNISLLSTCAMKFSKLKGLKNEQFDWDIRLWILDFDCIWDNQIVTTCIDEAASSVELLLPFFSFMSNKCTRMMCHIVIIINISSDHILHLTLPSATWYWLFKFVIACTIDILHMYVFCLWLPGHI